MTMVLSALLLLLWTGVALAQLQPPGGLHPVPGTPTRYNLSVTKAGTGSGTVTGPGVTCGADCSQSYLSGTTTVLHASPSGGSTFTGWSGACTGTSSCSVTMSQAQNVTATFSVVTAGCNITASSAGNDPAPNDFVQQAINASTDGQTVCVPAGIVTWTSAVTIPNTKSIALIGAGMNATRVTDGAPSAALFVTTKNTGGAFPLTYPGYTRVSGFEFTSGSTGYNITGWLHSYQFTGTSENLRFDNNRVIVTGAGGVNAIIFDGPFGVLHDNEFITSQCCVHNIVFQHSAYLGVGFNGNHSWAQPSTMGMARNLIFEDNLLRNTGALANIFISDGMRGARIVFRFNTQENGAQIQQHGTESGLRGYRHIEYYHNRNTNSFGAYSVFRGGTGFGFNNSGSGSVTNPLHINTYRSFMNSAGASAYPFGGCGMYHVTSVLCIAPGPVRSGVSYPFEAQATMASLCQTIQNVPTICVAGGAGSGTQGPQGSHVNISGANGAHFNRSNILGTNIGGGTFVYPITSCPNPGVSDGSASITVSNSFDGNTNSSGYPCIDQAGRGMGNAVTTPCNDCGPGWGGFTTPTGPVNQQLEPIYMWGNTCNGALCHGGESPGFPAGEENRDYYNQNTAACPSGGASCTAGIGVGTTLPTSCTAGRGFWKTNEGNWRAGFPNTSGKFYRCQGPGGPLDMTGTPLTWQPWYGNNNATGEPYTYPHPLRLVP